MAKAFTTNSTLKEITLKFTPTPESGNQQEEMLKKVLMMMMGIEIDFNQREESKENTVLLSKKIRAI